RIFQLHFPQLGIQPPWEIHDATGVDLPSRRPKPWPGAGRTGLGPLHAPEGSHPTGRKEFPGRWHRSLCPLAPGAEDVEQRRPDVLRKLGLRETASGSDGEAELPEVLGAARAEDQMLLQPGARLAIECPFQEIGQELHHLLASDVRGAGCAHGSALLAQPASALRTRVRAPCRTTR